MREPRSLGSELPTKFVCPLWQHGSVPSPKVKATSLDSGDLQVGACAYQRVEVAPDRSQMIGSEGPDQLGLARPWSRPACNPERLTIFGVLQLPDQ